ncbi:MAG: hypothetical protein NC301_03960 [Bacteroides sp.]|nr:hypothetical protein [Bacteroides sp.]MCM1378656.1 hypothetical protein [Bacteroides sp.]MCM1444929.1 hypothetical protein [Prevotella sp.]
MSHKYLSVLLCLIAATSCTQTNVVEEPEDVYTESSEDLIVYADQLSATFSGIDLGQWTLNGGDNLDWCIPEQLSGAGLVEINFSFLPNITGESRDVYYDINGENGKVSLHVIQSNETANGQIIELTLGQTLINTYPTYIYSSTFDFTKNPLKIYLNGEVISAETINEHNAVLTVSDSFSGESEMTVEIGDFKIDYGTVKIYTPESTSTPYFDERPVVFEGKETRLLACFNPDDYAQTLAFDVNGNKVQPYLICQKGICAGIDGILSIVPITPKYLLATIILADQKNYNDDTYTVFITGHASNILIDNETGVCYNISIPKTVENAVWAGDSNIVAASSYGQCYQISPYQITKDEVLQRANDIPEYYPEIEAKALNNAVYNSSYPKILAAGNIVQLSSAEYWDNTFHTVAPMPAPGIFTFASDDKHLTQYGIPIYSRGEILRVLNYSALSANGTNYRHECYIAPINSESSLIWEYWDNNSAIGRSYEIFATPDGTYLRPIIPDNAQFGEVKAYYIDKNNVNAYTLTEEDKKQCELPYGKASNGLLFGNTYPYQGNFRYAETLDKNIIAQPFDSYGEPLLLEGVDSRFINAQVMSDGIWFAANSPDGNVEFKYFIEGQTTPTSVIKVTANDMLNPNIVNFMGWMAAFN